MSGKKSIYVSSLHPQFNPEQLREIFGSFGNILDVRVHPDPSNGLAMCVIDFDKAESATAACQMNGQALFENTAITVAPVGPSTELVFKPVDLSLSQQLQANRPLAQRALTRLSYNPTFSATTSSAIDSVSTELMLKLTKIREEQEKQKAQKSDSKQESDSDEDKEDSEVEVKSKKHKEKHSHHHRHHSHSNHKKPEKRKRSRHRSHSSSHSGHKHSKKRPRVSE